MEKYSVTQELLPVGMNRPGTPLNATGVAIHETATPGATAENEAKYFSSGIRRASAHYFVDYDSIVQLIPENEIAWHAGKTANSRYISIELCHFDDPTLFDAVWQRGVWLCADICRRHDFSPDTDVVSHAWISAKWHETNHTDPTAYFQSHHKTFGDFLAAVKAELAALSGPAASQQAVIQTNKAVLYTTAVIDGQSAPAVAVDGKSYIGARELAAMLGFRVTWDPATQTVILTKQ